MSPSGHKRTFMSYGKKLFSLAAFGGTQFVVCARVFAIEHVIPGGNEWFEIGSNEQSNSTRIYRNEPC